MRTSLEIQKLYRQFRKYGDHAWYALRSARIYQRFGDGCEFANDLVSRDGNCRIIAKPEIEHPWDVYGIPDTDHEKIRDQKLIEAYGVWIVIGQVRDKSGDWINVDSVGMCYGYRDVLDVFENCYVIDLMAECLEHREDLELSGCDQLLCDTL